MNQKLAAPLAAAIALTIIGALAPPGSRRALVNSAILAAGAVAIALPLGTLLAVLLARFDVPGRRVAIACLGVLLFLPLYVQLSGWDAALGKLGWYSLVQGALAQPFLAGMRGAIFVHGMAAVPWVVLLIGTGLMQVDPAQEEAALLVLPPRGVLWRITLPQALPFIAAAAVWTIVGTTSEMTVTNIYLINPHEGTYTEQFYMRFAASDAERAAIGVLPGVAGLAVIILATLWMVWRVSERRVMASIARPRAHFIGRIATLSGAVVWLIVFVLLAVPIGSLVNKAGFIVRHEGGERIRAWSAAATLKEIAAVPTKFRGEIGGTTGVAAGAASVAFVMACVLAWRARRGGIAALPAIAIVVLGLSIPGPLVGSALIELFNHDVPPRILLGDGIYKSWLLILYDQTATAPILAQAIRALPLATLLLWFSFARLPDDVLEASALDGLSPLGVFWRIAVPQRWRAMTASWIAAFAVAAGDLAWAHLVTPPGLDLLQRRVFGLVHSGVEEQVAAISLVVIIAYAAMAIAVLALLRSQRRALAR